MNLKKIRSDFLQEAKPYIVKFGWNENLFLHMKKNSKFKHEEFEVLFPQGNLDLVNLYIDEINKKMTIKSKKINFLRLRTHERIRELFILRLKIISKEKKLISKTYTYLFLPHNSKLGLKKLYRTVDQMWFLAGDNSTDFNFYSKRMILASIYISVMIHFLNNNNIDLTIIFLDKQLKRVSKIPLIKNKITNINKILPYIFNLGKRFKYFKQ